MDVRRNQFFARPRFASDENRVVGAGRCVVVAQLRVAPPSRLEQQAPGGRRGVDEIDALTFDQGTQPVAVDRAEFEQSLEPLCVGEGLGVAVGVGVSVPVGEAVGVIDLTPGIRSLQVHFDARRLTQQQALDHVAQVISALPDVESTRLHSRIVHLPLSWDDPATQQATQRYMRSVRADAPWCPDNIEFIRRINGLQSVDEVRDILFSASYLVMGLGDVYLGAPVATPLDPRHRLVTTKYNPARTWTPENAVGIGGAYLCIYGMEGPGGYQFVGRTVQVWNRDGVQVYHSRPETDAPARAELATALGRPADAARRDAVESHHVGRGLQSRGGDLRRHRDDTPVSRRSAGRA